MKVSVQYAESHLTEAIEVDGDGPEIGDVQRSGPMAKRGLWGAGQGEIWMSDDWDSQETNEEIAKLFNDGPIFPGEPGA
jgi:hypothetical protein